MEENPTAQPIVLSNPTRSGASSGAASNLSKRPDSSRSHDDDLRTDSHLQQSFDNDDVRDKIGILDVQYIDVSARLEQLVKKTRELRNEKALDLSISSAPSDIHSSLATALIDLRIWANELSDDADFLLESLGGLASHNQALNASLEQILIDIRRQLASIDEKVDKVKTSSRISEYEQILQQCQNIRVLVDCLKTFKPSLREELSAWKSVKRSSPTGQTSSSRHALVLCFDGGGVKSYASLLILRKLMDLIRHETSHQSSTSPQAILTKPCDVFNFMYGSSSGGLIAVMLGRLEMTVDECIDNFCNYSDSIFSHPRLGSKILGGLWKSKYSQRRLVQATRLITGEFDPTPNSEKWKRNVFGVSSGQCKTGVLATVVSQEVPSPYMFRTYDCISPSVQNSPKRIPLNPGPASALQIWQVVRATSAAPSIFPPIQVEDQVFFDGGTMANNPSQEALRDVAFLHGDKLANTCLVSIGSGIFRNQDLPAPLLKSKYSIIQNWKNTIRILRNIATQTEVTNTDVQETSLDLGFPYFRFNPEFGRDIFFDEWVKSYEVSETGGIRFQTLNEIERSTTRYLQAEAVEARLSRCASIIVGYKLRVLGQEHPETLSEMVNAETNALQGVNVPRKGVTHFVVRAEILWEMDEWLMKKGRDTVLLGIGGSGKTQLALEYCRRVEETSSFAAVLWIDASSPASVIQSYKTIAAKVMKDSKNTTDSEANIKIVQEALREQKGTWLAVFDNFDDPQSFKKHDIQYYVPQAKNGCVLFTSRHADSQRLGHVIKVSGMSKEESLHLLLRRPASEEAELMQGMEIAAELGYLAVALDQAGAYICARNLKVKDFMLHYRKRKKVILQEVPDQWEYRRISRDTEKDTIFTVFTTWEMSFEQISGGKEIKDAKQHFLSLAAFFNNEIISLRYFEAYCKSKKPKWMQIFMTDGTWDEYKFGDVVAECSKLSLLQTLDKQSSEVQFSIHAVIQNWLKLRGKPEMQQSFIAELITALTCYLEEVEYEGLNLEIKQETILHINACIYNARELLGDLNGPVLHFPAYAASLFASCYVNEGLYDEAEELSKQALASNEEELGPKHLNTLRTARNLANVYRNKGRYNEAEVLSKRALAGIEKLGPKHPDTLRTARNLADVYRDEGRYDKAEELYKQVLAGTEEEVGPKHPDTLRTARDLAHVYRNKGRYDDAEELYKQVLAGTEEKLGPKHPDTLRTVQNLAIVYTDKGRYNEAEELFKRAFAGTEEKLGPKHPDTLRTARNLAITYISSSRYDEAEELSRRALAGNEEKLGAEHPDSLTSANILALVLRHLGKYEEAEMMFSRAVRSSEKVLGVQHPSTLTSMANLASTYKNQGRWAEAEKLEVQAMETRNRVLGEEHPDTLTSMANLASTYRNQGRWEEAKKLEEQAIKTRIRVLGSEHPDTLMSMNSLAETLNQGKNKEAEVMHLQTLELKEKVLGTEHLDTLTRASSATTKERSGA